jgi:hypothetical protein
MGAPTVKTAAVFKPKRNWKPKRRDRNISRRKKRKGWWRRNKNRLKLGRRRRYKMMKHNSMFKGWRKKRQGQKAKRRMRFGAEGQTNLPESWFVFRDDVEQGQPLDIDMGFIEDYDPDTEQLLIYDVDENKEKVVELDQFLTHSEFLEEADLDNFELIMDQFYGGPEDDLDIVPDSEEAPRMEFEVDMTEFAQKVANTWLLSAIRKE